MLMTDGVLGPTPMQSFKGSNFAGVPQPKLANDSKSHNYEASAGTGTEHKQIFITAAAFIIIAYIVWHFAFEK